MIVIRPNSQGYFPKLPHGYYGPVALGNVTQYYVGIIHTNRDVFISVEGKGSQRFTFYRQVNPYDMAALGITNKSDMNNMSDFVNSQLDLEGFKPVGYYREELCETNTQL